jgi:hypothetical protein
VRGLRRQHVLAAHGTCAAGEANSRNPGQVVFVKFAAKQCIEFKLGYLFLELPRTLLDLKQQRLFP